MCFGCFCDHHQYPFDRAYYISVHFFVGLLRKRKYSLMHVYGTQNTDTCSPYILVVLLYDQFQVSGHIVFLKWLVPWTMQYMSFYLFVAGLINLLCGMGNFRKFWFARRQQEIQYPE